MAILAFDGEAGVLWLACCWDAFAKSLATPAASLCGITPSLTRVSWSKSVSQSHALIYYIMTITNKKKSVLPLPPYSLLPPSTLRFQRLLSISPLICHDLNLSFFTGFLFHSILHACSFRLLVVPCLPIRLAVIRLAKTPLKYVLNLTESWLLYRPVPIYL